MFLEGINKYVVSTSGFEINRFSLKSMSLGFWCAIGSFFAQNLKPFSSSCHCLRRGLGILQGISVVGAKGVVPAHNFKVFS